MKKILLTTLVFVLVISFAVSGTAFARKVRVVAELNNFEEELIQELKKSVLNVNHQFPQIDAVALTVKEENIPKLQAMTGIKAVYRDQKVTVNAGVQAWDLDIIDVEKIHNNTYTDVDGSGVYVAVLDTGLLPHWKDYFSEESIATELGAGFLNPQGNINPGAWTGTHAHGTHVTSTVLGYMMHDIQMDGVAPGAKVIPVKVLNNQGSGYSSAVTAGILYIADLKAEGKVLEPIVINMSLGSSAPDPIELEAIKYAIDNGVIVVTSAGNSGEAGMGYPGAYDEVISVGASGWTDMWLKGFTGDVPEVNVEEETYVADFSSRELPGQYLDVLAPGDWIVGPYTLNGAAHPPQWAKQDKMGEYYYLSGTSMASPHVAGVAALMLEKNPFLNQRDIERILKDTALYISPNTVTVVDPYGGTTYTWGSDATGSGLIQADHAVEEAANY